MEEISLYGGEGDRFYIIDNLFNPVALEQLLEQLLCSTIWFDARSQPFEQYNSQPELNRARIERANAHSHVVPYRGNRAVVFPSKYLHKTNAATFSNAFAGRRINMTLMADKT